MSNVSGEHPYIAHKFTYNLLQLVKSKNKSLPVGFDIETAGGNLHCLFSSAGKHKYQECVG